MLSLAALAASCQSTGSTPKLLPPLARSRASEDLGSYSLRRVGLLPPMGAHGEEAAALHAALGFELTRHAPFEVVTLDAGDLAENFDEELLPGETCDDPAALASLRRLKKIRDDTGGELVLFHDPVYVERLQRAPAYYE